MSLYLGDDNNSNKILHITSTVESVQSLKSEVLPSTIFHTDLQFVTGKVYNLPVTHTNNDYHTVSIGELSLEAVSEIAIRFSGTKVPIVLVVADNKVYLGWSRINATDLFMWNYTDTQFLPNSAYLGHSAVIPTNSYRYKCIAGTWSTLQIILTNLDYDVLLDSISVNSYFTGPNSVNIGNNKVEVRGINLASIPFMTHKNIGSSTAIVGNASGDKLYIPNASTAQTASLNCNSTRVYIKNASDEYLFDTNIGAVYTLIVNTTPSFSTLSEFNGSYKIIYINNIVPEFGKAIFFCTYMSAWYPEFVDRSISGFMYIPSSDETFITNLSVTSSQTTYTYYIYTAYVTGILRVCVKMVLTRIGADGNPGFPPDMVFHKAIRIN